MPRAGRRRAFGWAATCGGLGLVLAFGCATQQQVTRVSPGVYRLECRESLARCLVGVADVCPAHGYDVLSASEKRDYIEQEPQGYESLKATATVRCREAVPLFGPDPNLPLPVASASASAAATSPPPVSASPPVSANPPVPPSPAPVPAPAPVPLPPVVDGGAP